MIPFVVTAAVVSAASVSWPAVDGDMKAFGLGKNDAAVIAGTSKPFVLPEIPGAAENATDWYRWLTQARGVPLKNAHLLRDGDVTKEALLAEVDKARKEVKPGGTLWVVFIGHGAPDPSGKGGLLLGVDVQPTIRSITDRGLPQKQLLDVAQGNGQHQVVAVFDACFSGSASDGSAKPLVPGSQATLPVKRADPSTKKLTILSSSEQVAGPLPRHDRPAFTYLLLGAARGWGDADADGTVTLKEAFDYTHTTLTTVVQDRNQTPSWRGSESAVVLATQATEEGPKLVDAVAGPASARGERGTRQTHDDDQFDVNAALQQYKLRRINVLGNDFVRGPYLLPVDLATVLNAGRTLAPEAVTLIERVDAKAGVAGSVFVGTMVVGTVAGGVVGGLTLAETFGSTTFTDTFETVTTVDATSVLTAAALGGVIGASVGLAAGAFAAFPFAPNEAEMRQATAARTELVDAINEAEREKLGIAHE